MIAWAIFWEEEELLQALQVTNIGKGIHGYHIDAKFGAIDMKTMIDRLFIRVYWFYDRVIKEENQDNRFYFTAFAISFLLFFYANFLVTYLYVLTEWSLLKFERIKFTLFAIIFLVSIMYLFYKKKSRFQQLVKSCEYQFTSYDIFTIFYVVVGLFLSYYSIVLFAENV